MTDRASIVERLREAEHLGIACDACEGAAALIELMAALLTRYRNETPLGHQPHMIAHEADALLAKVKPNG